MCPLPISSFEVANLQSNSYNFIIPESQMLILFFGTWLTWGYQLTVCPRNSILEVTSREAIGISLPQQWSNSLATQIWSWYLMYFYVDSFIRKVMMSLCESSPQLLHNILGDLENPKKRRVKKARRRKVDLWEGGRVSYVRFWIFWWFLRSQAVLKSDFFAMSRGQAVQKLSFVGSIWTWTEQSVNFLVWNIYVYLCEHWDWKRYIINLYTLW